MVGLGREVGGLCAQCWPLHTLLVKIFWPPSGGLYIMYLHYQAVWSMRFVLHCIVLY